MLITKLREREKEREREREQDGGDVFTMAAIRRCVIFVLRVCGIH
jgi:hypothetical protein